MYMIIANGERSITNNITHYNYVLLGIAGSVESIGLDISPLSHKIILRSPWLD
jgi:hypothetical protein